MEHPNLFPDQELTDFLISKRYFPGRKIGEGKHREVYEAFHIEQDRRQKRVIIKVPKGLIGLEEPSVQARINLSRGDPNRKEVERLKLLNHPNIVQILDTHEYKSSIITVEEFLDAQSLQQHVELFGPVLNQDKFLDLLLQATEALRYLHLEKKMLHRDLKPSNFLIGIDGKVKLIDFQFAASMDDVESKVLPTRGGTQYTHPKILEELLSGKESRVTVGSELYTLGAVMYYVLTGEHLFDFALVEDDKGKKIDINGKQVRIVIDDKGKLLQSINLRECCEQVQQKLKKIYFPEFKFALKDFLNPEHLSNDDAEKLHYKLKENFETYREHRINPFVWMSIPELRSGKKRDKIIGTKVKGQNTLLKDFVNEHEIMLGADDNNPIVLRETNTPEEIVLSTIIEAFASFTTAFGNWSRETHHTGNPNAHGSDACDHSLCTETYVYKEGEIEARVIDSRSTFRYGTMGQNWSDDNVREIIVLTDGKEIFQAYNHLSGETCYSHEPILKKGGDGWLIKKLALINYVVGQLDKMRGLDKETISVKLDFENTSETDSSANRQTPGSKLKTDYSANERDYSLENALSRVERDAVQWMPASIHENDLVKDYVTKEGAKSYTARIDNWQATIVHYNSDSEDEMHNYCLLFHPADEKSSAFIYGDYGAKEFPLSARERIRKLYQRIEASAS